MSIDTGEHKTFTTRRNRHEFASRLPATLKHYSYLVVELEADYGGNDLWKIDAYNID